MVHILMNVFSAIRGLGMSAYQILKSIDELVLKLFDRLGCMFGSHFKVRVRHEKIIENMFFVFYKLRLTNSHDMRNSWYRSLSPTVFRHRTYVKECLHCKKKFEQSYDVY